MTFRTSPCGGTTCGRVARPASCADSVAAETNATTPATSAAPANARVTRMRLHHLERLQPAGARPDLVHLDAVEVQQAEQHVRRPLRVVREHQVAVALERAVDAAHQDH